MLKSGRYFVNVKVKLKMKSYLDLLNLSKPQNSDNVVTLDHKKESKPGENPEIGGGGCDDSDIEDCPPKFKLEDSSKLFSENIPSSLQEAD